MNYERPQNPEQKFFEGFRRNIEASKEELAGPGGKSLFLEMFNKDLRESGLTEIDGLPVEDAVVEMSAAIHDQKRVEDILPSVRGLFMDLFPGSLQWKPESSEARAEQTKETPAAVTPITRGEEIKYDRMHGDELTVAQVLVRSTSIGEIVDKLNQLGQSLSGIDGEKVAAQAVDAYNTAKAGHPELLDTLPEIVQPAVRKVLLSEQLKTIY